jgi:hypothetical protein
VRGAKVNRIEWVVRCASWPSARPVLIRPRRLRWSLVQLVSLSSRKVQVRHEQVLAFRH